MAFDSIPTTRLTHKQFTRPGGSMRFRPGIEPVVVAFILLVTAALYAAQIQVPRGECADPRGCGPDAIQSPPTLLPELSMRLDNIRSRLPSIPGTATVRYAGPPTTLEELQRRIEAVSASATRV